MVLVILGVVVLVIALVGFSVNLFGGGTSLIGVVVLESIAIPLTVLGVILIVAGFLW